MPTTDPPSAARFRPPRRVPLPGVWIAAVLIAAIALIAVLAGGPVRALIAGRARAMAAARGLDLGWTSLGVALPLDARFAGLTLTRRSDGVVLVRADSVAARLDPWSLLRFAPRLARVELAGVAVTLAARRGADPDTLLLDDARTHARGDDPARAERVREAARALARLLASPARSLPAITLRDLTVGAAGDDDEDAAASAPAARLEVERFSVAPDRAGVRIAATGALATEQRVRFALALDYGRDDRLSATARFAFGDSDAAPETLRVAIAGTLRQNRRAGRAMLVEPTRLTIGSLAFALAGEADARGPRFRLALDADSLTARAWQASLPRTVLGPLADLAIAGWYAWSVRLDLDVARPDSVAFDADVTPHGLTIDRARNRLPIETLDRPFVARIHLPHDRIVERDLSPANPHFLPLDAIDTLLVRALLANEDGGFFRHRGFNLEAVRGAIADDVKAGAFRRGAGTITMQLVRNLYLGHRRTLARKGQEVALAWILEHLTTLTKERMLEIYLNIIEWGPDVHGADEACGYYFGHGAGHVTVDEALFLATVVPAPGKWRYRFDRDGALRPFARAQMHFIGRAMAARGWLAPDLLPDADQLRVAILGPARDALFPPASASRRPGTPGDRVLRTAPSAMDFPPDLGRLALGRGAR